MILRPGPVRVTVTGGRRLWPCVSAGTGLSRPLSAFKNSTRARVRVLPGSEPAGRIRCQSSVRRTGTNAKDQSVVGEALTSLRRVLCALMVAKVRLRGAASLLRGQHGRLYQDQEPELKRRKAAGHCFKCRVGDVTDAPFLGCPLRGASASPPTVRRTCRRRRGAA